MTTAKIMSGRMMSPETGVGPGASDVSTEDSGGGGETVKIGDRDVDDSEFRESWSGLRRALFLVGAMGCNSEAGDSLIEETTTAGGGETALSKSSSSGCTDLPNEVATGVFSSRISSSDFSLSGGSFDKPSSVFQKA